MNLVHASYGCLVIKQSNFEAHGRHFGTASSVFLAGVIKGASLKQRSNLP